MHIRHQHITPKYLVAKSLLCTLFRKSICLTFYDIDKYIEIEKAEAKYRRSHEEYKTSVALFGNARDDFERKMTLATRRFQVTSLTTQNSVTKLLFLSNLL